jgi:hypothetical protein
MHPTPTIGRRGVLEKSRVEILNVPSDRSQRTDLNKKFIMTEEDLFRWFNKKSNDQLTSFEDHRLSRNICYYLITLTGDTQIAPKVQLGKTHFERSTNFQIAKSLFGQMNRGFDYNIAMLVDGNHDEIMRLVRELATLDTDEKDEDIPLDNLLDALQDDLVNKLREARAFREEMDAVAEERDFYFQKLVKASVAAKKYPRDVVCHVLEILELAPPEFLAPQVS